MSDDIRNEGFKLSELDSLPKPAATESGEPQWVSREPGFPAWRGKDVYYNTPEEAQASFAAVPTSPSSQPTVTDVTTSDLTLLAGWANQQSTAEGAKAREAFNMLGHWAIIAAQYAPHRFLLALLRAAEQKPSKEAPIITTSLNSKELEDNRKAQAEYGRKRGFEKPGEPRL